MRLETVAETYGMVDYFEQRTGRIYQLSKAEKKDSNTLRIPVIQDGVFIGYAEMKGKVK